ncbi:MAG: hypothetical protein E7626_01335 [Ruminococcaceae bacterium]|nr:hypothetical protein [Oscillospiraceae bacterium]
MKKIIFRILGVICLLILTLQFSATPTESLAPVIKAAVATASAFICFAVSEITVVEDDDDDDRD